MKVRFDTNTKSVEAATQAFATLYKYCPDLRIDKSSWQEDVINLNGEIESQHVTVLEEATINEFNEDADKL